MPAVPSVVVITLISSSGSSSSQPGHPLPLELFPTASLPQNACTVFEIPLGSRGTPRDRLVKVSGDNNTGGIFSGNVPTRLPYISVQLVGRAVLVVELVHISVCVGNRND